MSTSLAFSESQAKLLSQLASVRTALFDYTKRAALLDAHRDGNLTAELDRLSALRHEIAEWILEFPPRVSWSFYCAHNPARILAYEADVDGQHSIRSLAFSGSDPLLWIDAAYSNAEKLKGLIDDMLLVCKQASSSDPQAELFELDPPRLRNDPRVPVIRKHLCHFIGMAPEDVLHVFDARKGNLSMAHKQLWKNATIAEGIRRGLALKPSALRSVNVLYGEKCRSWLSTDNRSNNHMGSTANSARTKCFEEYPKFELEALDIERELGNTIKR